MLIISATVTIRHLHSIHKRASLFELQTIGIDIGSTRRFYFPEHITSFRQLQDLNIASTRIPTPANLNIVFVGDSVTRYQYLSLAYFLHFGRWINTSRNWATYNDTNANEVEVDAPDMGMIWKKSESTMREWFNYSNFMLTPFERCDCFEPSHDDYKMFGVNGIENRFYRQPLHNISAVYLKKLGFKNNHARPLTFKSTWNLTYINEMQNSKIQNHRRSFLTELPDDMYQNDDWTSFIRDFVSKLRPKPNVFVFNQGLWNHDDFLNTTLQKEIIKAISDAGMVSVYKTTTRWSSSGAEGAVMDSYERQICDLADVCLDLSWTWMVPEFLYVDRAHFLEPVYTWFNLQLLDLLYRLK